MADAPSRHFEVSREDAGTRLDRFLADQLGLSRSQARKLLAGGGVKVGTQPCDASSKGLELSAGEVVEVGAFTPPDEQEPIPEPERALPVLAEGAGWLAVDKPAGMPVHPLRAEETGTVLNALVVRHPELVGVGEGALRSGVVHRLDVETSGVLLVATEQPAWERLREAFRAHRVRKRYLAVVHGRPEAGAAELPLYVAARSPARVRVASERGEGRPTRTAWRPLASGSDTTLLEVTIETGFLHQIRATLAHLGHPVLGDRTYAPPEIAARAPRQLLHASQVALEEIEATSPTPLEIESFAEEPGVPGG